MNLIKCEKLEKSMAELQFSIDAEAFKKAVADVFKKESKKYAVPGFRKGKAPRSLIEKMYGADVFTYDAINELFPEAFEAAVKEANVEPVGRPEVSVDAANETEGVTLTVKVAVKPEIKVGNYNGLTVEKTVHTVTDEAVDAELKRVQERNARELTREGAAENGDIVDIDFEGFVDGVAFEGGKAEHHELTLGSGAFIPGFEDQLIGCKAGDEKDVVVTFPEEYHAKELAGKEATFKCKVHKVEETILPEIDDEFAKDVSDTCETLDDLKKEITERLKAERQEAADNAFEEKVLDAVIDGMKADIPAAMIDAQVDNMLRETAQRMQSQGLSMDLYMKYTGMTADQMKDQMRPEAVKRIQTRLVLEAVVKAENIETSEEKLDEEIAKMAEAYKMEADKLKSYMTDSDKDQMKQDLAVQAAVDLLVSEAKLV